jgi:hypothetical protein
MVDALTQPASMLAPVWRRVHGAGVVVRKEVTRDEARTPQHQLG